MCTINVHKIALRLGLMSSLKNKKQKKINYVLLKNHATCSEIFVFEIVLKLFVDQKIQFAAIHNVKLRNKTVDYIERKPNCHIFNNSLACGDWD